MSDRKPERQACTILWKTLKTKRGGRNDLRWGCMATMQPDMLAAHAAPHGLSGITTQPSTQAWTRLPATFCTFTRCQDANYLIFKFAMVTDVSATPYPASVSAASDTSMMRNEARLLTLKRRCSACITRSTKGVSATAQLKRRGRSSCCASSKPVTLPRNACHCPAANGILPAEGTESQFDAGWVQHCALCTERWRKSVCACNLFASVQHGR